jgi:hypothetical protein
MRDHKFKYRVIDDDGEIVQLEMGVRGDMTRKEARAKFEQIMSAPTSFTTPCGEALWTSPALRYDPDKDVWVRA